MDSQEAKSRGQSGPMPDGASTLDHGGEAIEWQRTEVRRMFDRVSRRYDLLNHLLSLGLDRKWRREAVREMKLAPSDGMLDVACGTGDLAFEAFRSAPHGLSLGIDFSRSMLRIATDKGNHRRSESVRFSAAAAERLPVRADAFAAAGIAFGIRNVPDRLAALGEMVRAVRPGGRVVILEFTTSGEGAMARVIGFYLHRLLPRIGGMLSSRGAYRYLAESMRAFPEPAAFAGEMAGAGLVNVRFRRLPPAPTWLYVGEVPHGGANLS